MRCIARGFLHLILIWRLIGTLSVSTFDEVRIIHNDRNNFVIFFENSIEGIQPFKLYFPIDHIVEDSRVFTNCSLSGDQLCRLYSVARFVVTQLDDRCLTINLSSTLADVSVNVEIDFTNVHLYGGAEHVQIQWPIDKMSYEHRTPYVTRRQFYQAILERFWLSSNGVYIHVHETVPLFIRSDPEKRKLTLIAEYSLPYRKRDPNVALNFTLCKFDNVRSAHKHAIEHVLGKPSALPDIERIRHPIWSTWVKYKENIHEEIVYKYAEEIADHGYRGQIEIDDNWEKCYGSLTPDKSKFPNMKGLVSRIKQLNFRVTIWIHPFVNADCQPVHEFATKRDYFVRSADGNVFLMWWRGNASYVDFTNPEATRWFRKRLMKLRDIYDIDSFKFDGGESDFSPQPAVYHSMRDDYPETIAKEYVRMIASMGSNVHTRVAVGTQRYPIFVTMMDRNSYWGRYLGLSTVVSELLQMNVLGYSFVLPDMIGGNFYGMKASSELFIRWVQVNVFMPSMQFSIPPWDYGEEVNNLVKSFVELHYEYSPKIIALMRLNVKTGAPVNPPLWWIAPNDTDALSCDSEFLLGEDILVAPILTEGARKRDVYLPAGIWRDMNRKHSTLITGPTWLRDYPAELDVLPFFQRVSDKPLESAYHIRTVKNDTSIIDYISYDSFLLVLSISELTFVLMYVFYDVCRRFRRRQRLLVKSHS